MSFAVAAVDALTDDCCSWIDQPDGPSWGEYYGEDVDLLNMEQFVAQIEERDFESGRLLKNRFAAQKKRLKAEAVIRAKDHEIEAAEEAVRAAEEAAQAEAAKKLEDEVAAQQAAAAVEAAAELERKRTELFGDEEAEACEAEERAQEKASEFALKAAFKAALAVGDLAAVTKAQQALADGEAKKEAAAAADASAARCALEAAQASGDPAAITKAQGAWADARRTEAETEIKIGQEAAKKKAENDAGLAAYSVASKKLKARQKLKETFSSQKDAIAAANLLATQVATAAANALRKKEEIRIEDSRTSILRNATAGLGDEVDEEPEVSYSRVQHSAPSLTSTCCIVYSGPFGCVYRCVHVSAICLVLRSSKLCCDPDRMVCCFNGSAQNS